MNGNIPRLLLFGLLTLAGLNGALSAQVQVEKLAPPGVEKGHFFGAGIAVSRDTAVLAGAGYWGASWKAYVYERSEGSWNLVQELGGPPSAPKSLFGRAVAIDGDWIALAGGAVQLFRRVEGTWVLAQTIGLADSVAIDGTTLVSGLANLNTVLVYELVEDTWLLQTTLKISIPNQLFGRSVDIDEDWILVGAPEEYWVFPSKYGLAYFYQRVTGPSGSTQWVLAKRFKGGLSDAFGETVVLDGRTAMVGAPGHFDTGGGDLNMVHVFDLSPSGTWSKSQVIDIPDSLFPGWAHDDFGGSLSLVGDEAIIGADQYLSKQFGSSFYLNGAAYHYRRRNGWWTCLGRLRTTDQELHDYTGTAVALAGGQALVGVPGRDDVCSIPDIQCNSGAVYVFDLAPDAIQFCSCQASAACSNPEPHGGCSNSTGLGAVLAAAGSSSVAMDALLLEARWLPPEVPVLWRVGDEGPHIPFGDGLLCLANALELHAAGSGPYGVASVGPGIVALAQTNLPPPLWIQAGQSRSFQCAYRDTGGPCGEGFNVTNAVRVSFQQ